MIINKFCTDMKLTLLILIGTLSTSLSLTAQVTLPHLNSNFIALRNSEHVFYKVGKRLAIEYNIDSFTQRVKGMLAGAKNGSIMIGAKGVNKSTAVIPIADISMVRKVHPQRRVAFGIIGTALVAGGTAILGSAGNSPGSAMRNALVIPIIGIGSYFLFAVPVSLMVEKLSEKKQKNGWKFEISEQ
jgi:hypothetical protein